MSRIESKVRNYVFTQEELKGLLGLKGDIEEMGFWQGRSTKDEQEGVSRDTNQFFICTKERLDEEEKTED